MENHNWTGDNSGAAFGAPDIKCNPLAPYVNGALLKTAAHAKQYFNPPDNHPSPPNYLRLEAGTISVSWRTYFPLIADINSTRQTTPPSATARFVCFCFHRLSREKVRGLTAIAFTMTTAQRCKRSRKSSASSRCWAATNPATMDLSDLFRKEVGPWPARQ